MCKQFGSLPFNLVLRCCFHVIKGSTCKTPSSEDQVPNPTWIRSTRIHRGPDVTDIHPQVPSARTHGASPHRAASMPSNHGKQKWKRPKVIYNGFSIMHTLNLARFKRTVCLNLKKTNLGRLSFSKWILSIKVKGQFADSLQSFTSSGKRKI